MSYKPCTCTSLVMIVLTVCILSKVSDIVKYHVQYICFWKIKCVCVRGCVTWATPSSSGRDALSSGTSQLRKSGDPYTILLEQGLLSAGTSQLRKSGDPYTILHRHAFYIISTVLSKSGDAHSKIFFILTTNTGLLYNVFWNSLWSALQILFFILAESLNSEPNGTTNKFRVKAKFYI